MTSLIAVQHHTSWVWRAAPRRAGPTLYSAVLFRAPRPSRRANLPAQALMPPFRRMNWSSGGAEPGLYPPRSAEPGSICWCVAWAAIGEIEAAAGRCFRGSASPRPRLSPTCEASSWSERPGDADVLPVRRAIRPPLLRALAAIDPLSYGVDGVRTLLMDASHFGIATDVTEPYGCDHLSRIWKLPLHLLEV
jgi:hypothetical protein